MRMLYTKIGSKLSYGPLSPTPRGLFIDKDCSISANPKDVDDVCDEEGNFKICVVYTDPLENTLCTICKKEVLKDQGLKQYPKGYTHKECEL